MKLAGLDFETANGKLGSICAAGCAILDNGVVAQRREWLVCPHKGYRWMRQDFTAIHGLSYWDVCGCAEFVDIWPELRRMLLSADYVVIHNAPFDLGHLRSTDSRLWRSTTWTASWSAEGSSRKCPPTPWTPWRGVLGWPSTTTMPWRTPWPAPASWPGRASPQAP